MSGPGHFPLSRAMLCVNCDSVFPAEGQQACPGCGSDVIASVANFLVHRQGEAYVKDAVAELTTLHVLPQSA